MELIENLNWRYATKRMTGAKVPDEKLQRILDAIRLAPSSFGLQPYEVLVIESEALRKQIQPLAFNQAQIAEASHLLIFAAWDSITTERADAFINLQTTVRKPDEATLAYMQGTLSSIVSRGDELNALWAAKQTYIALGIGIVAAANEQVDASPMEGFNPQAVDELLGLKERGLKSVSFLALGYRDTMHDRTAAAPKVRRPKEEIFIELDEAVAVA